MNEFISRVRAVLFAPQKFFEEVLLSESGTSASFSFTAKIFIIATAISYLMNLIIPFSGLITINVGGVQPEMFPLLIGHIMYYFMWLIFSFIIAAIWFLLFWIPSIIFRAEFNYSKTYQVLMYAFTPLCLFGSFPYIKFVAALWFIILVVIGCKFLYRISYIKSVFVVVTPFVVLIGILLAIFISSSKKQNIGADGIVKVRPVVIYNQQIAAGFNAGADNPMALYTAARYDNISRAKELLDEGANPNAKNHFGHYPLHGAIMSSSPDTNMVVLLLAHGAEVDVRLNPKGPKSPNQWTPLFYAVYDNYKDIAEILIKNGADVNLKDIWGDRPLHYARERGHEDMIKLLKEHGAKE